MLQSDDCNRNRKRNHLVPKQTLNHLANQITIKLEKNIKKTTKNCI